MTGIQPIGSGFVPTLHGLDSGFVRQFKPASGGFSEQGVVVDADYLLRASNADWVGAANAAQALFFFSAAPSAITADHALYTQNGLFNYIRIRSNGTIQIGWRDSGDTIVLNTSSSSSVGEERLNALLRLDFSGGTSELMVWQSGSGWTSFVASSSVGNGTIELTANYPTICANFNGTNQFVGTMYRTAAWYGVDVDVTDSAVQNLFSDPTTGALVDPATSVGSLGTPIFDFYGDADTWNAGTNQGSGGDSVMHGAVVDA